MTRGCNGFRVGSVVGLCGTGRVAHTARYRIHRLIFVEWCDTAPDAIAREKQLKGWRRSRKIARINRSNPDWRDLSNELVV